LRGQYVSKFGTLGTGPGELNHPYGITVDSNNFLYISDGHNDRICVFTTDGLFIRSFGSPGKRIHHFNRPHGLVFDEEGYLYICDYYNKRIVIY
jgi:DNA-binding beta-propeller fold protein YncE